MVLIDIIKRIESYTSELEKIPLEEFILSSAARATFISALRFAASDIYCLVQDINMWTREVIEMIEMGLDYDKYIDPKRLDIDTCSALLDRFIKCFYDIKGIVLGILYEDIDQFVLDDANSNVAYVEEALRAYRAKGID